MPVKRAKALFFVYVVGIIAVKINLFGAESGTETLGKIFRKQAELGKRPVGRRKIQNFFYGAKLLFS